MGHVLRIAIVDPEDASCDALKSSLLSVGPTRGSKQSARVTTFSGRDARTSASSRSMRTPIRRSTADLSKSGRGVLGSGHEQLDGR